MSVASGVVTQSANGGTLTFTDTGTYGTVSSRELVIRDSDGEILDEIDMGASLTATYTITADIYASFELTVIDNTGTYTTTVNYLSTAFYDIVFANVIAQLGCNCNCGSEQLTYADISQLYKSAAERYALSGLAPAAQNAITAANTIINGN